MLRTIALTGFAALLAASTIALAPPARAQIGNIFSDPAPRPPGAIPRGNQQQQAPDDEEEVPELPQGRLLPTPNRPLPPGRPCRRRDRCSRSRWRRRRAPPSFRKTRQPGIAVAPPQPGQGVAVAPPGANPPPGTPASASRRACRRRRRRCSPATRSSPSRRRRRSSTRRRVFPGSTRSPGASSISTRISARPSSSARSGSRPTPATPARPPRPPIPTPLSRSTRSRCRAR